MTLKTNSKNNKITGMNKYFFKYSQQNSAEIILPYNDIDVAMYNNNNGKYFIIYSPLIFVIFFLMFSTDQVVLSHLLPMLMYPFVQTKNKINIQNIQPINSKVHHSFHILFVFLYYLFIK